MNNITLPFMSTILIGLGATLITDLWALFLQRAFKMNSPDYCLVGRWLLYMPEGTFRHTKIASTLQKSAECTVVAPFFVMQPAFGLGYAASKTSNPAQARLRSLLNHALFGIGLYLCGSLVRWSLQVFA